MPLHFCKLSCNIEKDSECDVFREQVLYLLHIQYIYFLIDVVSEVYKIKELKMP